MRELEYWWLDDEPHDHRLVLLSRRGWDRL